MHRDYRVAPAQPRGGHPSGAPRSDHVRRWMHQYRQSGRRCGLYQRVQLAERVQDDDTRLGEIVSALRRGVDGCSVIEQPRSSRGAAAR